MYINVVYPKRIPSFWIRRKSRHFFSQTEYTGRNGVFVHKTLDRVFSLNRNTIRINCPNNDLESEHIVIQYLKYIFGETTIGLVAQNSEDLKKFHTINFVSI